MSQIDRPYFLQRLEEEFTSRKLRNSRYSLRRFADFLGLNSGTLSSIFAGRRLIPDRNIETIIRKLNLSASDRNRFIQSLNGRSSQVEESCDFYLENVGELYQNWDCFAVLSLFRKKNYFATEDMVARKTGIHALRAASTLESLKTLGFLDRHPDGSYSGNGKNIRIVSEWSSIPTRHVQRKALNLSLENLDTAAIETSKYSFMMVSLDKRKLNLLKRKILKFRNEIEEMHNAENSGGLYQVNFCLFPLSTD